MIRAAREEDLPAILDLYADAGLDGGKRMAIARAREKFARIASYPDYRLYVHEDADGTVTGTYALLVMDNIAHDGKPLTIVEQVAVSAGRQGQGIGTRMMEHAMAVSREAGCYKLALSSNVRFVAAHRFYEKLGFARHGYSFVVDLDAPAPAGGAG